MNDSIHFSAATVVLVVVIGGAWPGACTTASAEEGEEVRSAGSEEQFRVVERFSDAEDDDVEAVSLRDESPLKPVVTRVRHEEWGEAAEQLRGDELSEFIDEDPESQFLAGYVAHRADETERAIDLFDGLCGRIGSIEDYCAYYLATAALQAGEAHRAVMAAASVDDDSLLYPDALLVLAEALVEAGEVEDQRRAVDVLETYLGAYADRNDAASARLMLGETLESLERTEEAAQAYIDLRDEHPLRDEADEAEQRLDELQQQLGDQWAGRIEGDPLERTMRKYRGLHGLHRSERVIEGLRDEVDEFPSDAHGQRCEALYMIADSHTKLRRHGDAVPWYDRVLDECEDVENYEVRALYRTARSRWNAGDYDGAIKHWERIWTEYPDHSFADDAMHFTARIMRSDDRKDEALEMLHRQVERYPDGDMAKDGHWFIVRHYFEQDDYDRAVEYIDGLDDTREDDLYTRGRLHYFRARALQRVGQLEDAESGYADVVETYPKSYYALLAFNRLAQISGIEADDACGAVPHYCERFLSDAAGDDDIDIPRRLSEDDGFTRGSLLLALGLNSRARAEFSALIDRYADDDATLWALASLLDDTDAHPISHNIARRHINGWMTDYPDSSTRQLWEIAYPRPFAKEVDRYAQRRDGVDAAKIWAIMREESGFNPRIESWANARGLLQLLEDTGQRMATRVGMDSFSFDRLDEPDVNVRLGTAYMELLGERLQAHPALVSAGYNGGLGNVSRWLDEFGDLPLDLFVEDIPFHQTRNYTKRVMMSYWIYSYLHGDRRVPRIAFELSE